MFVSQACSSGCACMCGVVWSGVSVCLYHRPAAAGARVCVEWCGVVCLYVCITGLQQRVRVYVWSGVEWCVCMFVSQACSNGCACMCGVVWSGVYVCLYHRPAA